MDSIIKRIMRLAMTEQFDEARVLVRQLVEAEPLDVGIKVLQADIENLSGNESEALRQLNEILRINPEFGPAYYSTGILYAHQRRFDLAKTFFEKSLELLDSGQKEFLSDVWLQLGLTLWEQRSRSEAIEAWQKSLSLNSAQWKAKEYLEEFTSNYSNPKIHGDPLYFQEFQNLQVQIYLIGKGKTEFVSFDEADSIIRRITEVWNNIPEKWKLEDFSYLERNRYFKSFIIF